MYTLVVKSESTSIKLKLIGNNSTLFEARADHLSSTASTVTVKTSAGKKQLSISDEVLNHKSVLKKMIEYILSNSIISSLADISCVCHRVDHDSTISSNPVIITDDVIRRICECHVEESLHNPASITGIRICQELLPVPQVAIFGKMVRYECLTRSLSEIVGGKDKICAIMAYIGEEKFSICSIKQGKIIYTSNEILNLDSDLYEICDNNIIKILDRIKDDEKYFQAFHEFCTSIAENIAKGIIHLAMSPMQIVFSGYIGRNSDIVREEILKKLYPILSHIYLDFSANSSNDTKISSFISAVDVYVIPTDEELEIATQAYELLTQS